MELDFLLSDKMNEECGVFGVFNVSNASEVMYYGLHALQHRGQEGCGIITTDGSDFYTHKGEGLITEVFDETTLSKLEGKNAIGHVRYSTSGGGGLLNVQPFYFRHHTGDFGICHNGNIVNSNELRKFLEVQGSIFQSTSDTEILAHLIKKDNYTERVSVIKDALNKLEGAFAFLTITKDKLYVMRDKNALRPLSIGTLNGGYVVSSETCALEIVGATFLRDVLPGEIVIIEEGNISSEFYASKTYDNMCAMEYIYFSRPDSNIEGVNVHHSRKEAGKYLAKNDDVEADIVVFVPDSSTSCATGYSEESGIPIEMGLVKNRYVGRTFIKPSQELREKGVKMKLSPVRSIVKDKRVVLIDDSIVRGTTSKKIIELLRDAGAKEVHMRIAAPPITAPCCYGVDTSTYDELISAFNSVEEVREIINADSLKFLQLEDIYKACGRSKMCTSCFTGNYPTHLYTGIEKTNKEGK